MEGQCLGLTKGGARCRAYAMPGGDYCIAHEPSRIADLAEYRKQGGHGRSKAAQARKRVSSGGRDVAWLTAAVLDAVEEVKAGTLDPKVANAVANLARVGLTALGVVDIDQQIADGRRKLALVKQDA